MERVDMRRLSPAEQLDLRRQVLAALRERGMSKSEASRTFGVSRQSIYNWLGQVGESGSLDALVARKRGRKAGSGRAR